MKNDDNLLNLSFPLLHKLLIDCLPVNIFIVDKNGYMVWANQRMLKTLNESMESFIGKHISFWGDSMWISCQTVMQTESEQGIEEIGIDQRIYFTNRTPIKKLGHDEVQGIIGISLDITDRKQSEIAKQAFLMNMAHDLRTPLAGIIGLASIQADQGSNPQERQYGHWVHNAGEQLLDLLNAVLTVIDTEKMIDSIQEEPIHLAKLAKELQALMQPAIEAKKLEFELKLDDRLPAIISDQIKLKRLLLNLLSNAVKFTKEGKISLEIDLLSIEEDHAKIEIRVTDTGIGIGKDKIDKIFDRFYRAYPSYEAEYKGYGIGLYLVQKTIELLGGEIKVSSQEGKGSSFSLEFIFSIYHDPIDKFIHSRIELPKKSHGLEKTKDAVLIAEDNDLVLYAVKKLLVHLDYEVTGVTDGKAALHALQTQSFVWALLDIGLPGLSGIEVVQQYRQWEQENSKPHLPLFALTAHAEKSIKDKCKEVGINHIFHKPFTEKDTQTIQKFLDK